MNRERNQNGTHGRRVWLERTEGSEWSGKTSPHAGRERNGQRARAPSAPCSSSAAVAALSPVVLEAACCRPRYKNAPQQSPTRKGEGDLEAESQGVEMQTINQQMPQNMYLALHIYYSNTRHEYRDIHFNIRNN